MGSAVSCDICNKELDQDTCSVYELKDGDPEHVCVECFDQEKHKQHTFRTVYAVVGERNARMLNASGRMPELMQGLEQGFSNCTRCECGAETVNGPDVTACFACGKPFA